MTNEERELCTHVLFDPGDARLPTRGISRGWFVLAPRRVLEALHQTGAITRIDIESQEGQIQDAPELVGAIVDAKAEIVREWSN
jgi:hypothetical protein